MSSKQSSYGDSSLSACSQECKACIFSLDKFDPYRHNCVINHLNFHICHSLLTPFLIAPSSFLYAVVAWPDLLGIDMDIPVSTVCESRASDQHNF